MDIPAVFVLRRGLEEAAPRAAAHMRASTEATSASPSVARRTDRIKSASRRRRSGITGQGSLPCYLACSIHIKDKVAAPLPIPDTPDGIVRPPRGLAVLLQERAKCFQAGTVYAR
jgi:hypothetical protein